MEVNQQILKRAIKFLGLIFMVCGCLLFVYYLFIPPEAILLFFAIIPQLVFPILILSVGIALNMISEAL